MKGTTDIYSAKNYKENIEKLDAIAPIYYENLHDQPNFAYLNWLVGHEKKALNFKQFGENYLVGCLSMLDVVLKDNSHRLGDRVIYPIIFDAIHGIELYLKAFLFEMKYDDEAKIWGHSVKRLLSLVQETSNNEKYFSLVNPDMRYVELFLDEIFKYSDDTTFARYPNDRSGYEQFFVNSKNNIIIDMKILRIWIGAIFYILDRNFINLYCSSRQ